MKMFRVISTCDRKYNTFGLKKKRKHSIKDLQKQKQSLKNSLSGQK